LANRRFDLLAAGARTCQRSSAGRDGCAGLCAHAGLNVRNGSLHSEASSAHRVRYFADIHRERTACVERSQRVFLGPVRVARRHERSASAAHHRGRRRCPGVRNFKGVHPPLGTGPAGARAAGAAPVIIGCNCAGRGRCDLCSWRNVRRGPVDLLPLRRPRTLVGACRTWIAPSLGATIARRGLFMRGKMPA